MALITWTAEDYGTNVVIADNEHKTLFDMLNALHELAAGGDRAAIGKQLDELINFVVKHFGTEERLMQQKGYPGYAAHKAEHEKLVGTCAGLQKQFHAGEAEVTQDTTAFVKGWLDQHIPNFDKPYGPCLSA
jgi:hemerythrin